jgi:acyl-ACP thioesterase
MGFERDEIGKDAWREEFVIRSYEVDMCGKVPVPVILNFAQEAASNHADSLKLGIEDLESMDRFWVLSRIRIDVADFPRWGDLIVLHTWPGGTYRLFAQREFRFADDAERVIISASSAWLVLDTRTRRPVRIEQMFIDRGLPLERDPRCAELDKLPPMEGNDHESHRTVQLSDLDINDHVNNARYVEWVLNTYSRDFVQQHEVCGCEINFLSECGYAEEVLIRTWQREDKTYQHAVVRREQVADICRLVLKWRIQQGT